MKASELRIGNYISHIPTRKTDTVNLLQPGLGVSHSEVNGVNINGLYEPIPLDYEWLVKFGFNLCGSKIRGNPDILTIQISNNETLDYEDEEFFIAGVNSNRVVSLWNSPKYVHQLQNLYFALTGEELTIK